MEKQHGPWKIKSTERIYENEFLTVNEDSVIKPDDKPGKYTTVEMKTGAATLVMDDEKNVYLTEQFRYAIGKNSIEVVAGGIEEGEEPLETAKKEVKEELGIEAEEWTEYGLLNTDTSIVKSPAHLFLARKLKFDEPEQEGSEEIKLTKMGLEEAVEKVLNGEITHAVSCYLILKAHLNGQKRNQPRTNTKEHEKEF